MQIRVLETFKELLNKKEYSFLALLTSLFLLPLSINLSTFLFFVAVGFKLIQILFFKESLFSSKALRYSSIIGLIFFLYIILNSILQTSILYTVEVFEKQFLHWTLLFLTPTLIKEFNKRLLLKALFTGIIIGVLYIFFFCIINKISFNQVVFQKVFDIHHTYLSLYLLIMINFALTIFAENKNSKPKIFKNITPFLCIVLPLIIIFKITSKVSIGIIICLIMVHIINIFPKRQFYKYALVLSALILVFLSFNRYINVSYERALDFRVEVWKQAVDIIKDNPIFGDLKAQEKDLLNQKHYIDGKYYFMDSDLNSHNQYLSLLVKYGIIGLIIMLSYLFLIFRQNQIKSLKHTEILGFLTIIALSCLIENILDRHHGIVFFAVFYNYYLVRAANA